MTETSPTKKKLWKENNPKTPPKIIKLHALDQAVDKVSLNKVGTNRLPQFNQVQEAARSSDGAAVVQLRRVSPNEDSGRLATGIRCWLSRNACEGNQDASQQEQQISYQ
jgi:hypothetical protein